MLNGQPGEFPFAQWHDCSRAEWVERVAEWFEYNYPRSPQPQMARQTMAVLLDHIFEILHNSQPGDPYRRQIVALGRKLKDSPTLNPPDHLRDPHHHRIVCLFELDLASRHSHMFILPQVDKRALLERPDYSTLLLAAKLHVSGDYQDATQAALDISSGCSLAHYIIGQSERKQGAYDSAQVHLNEALRLLDQGGCRCPFAPQAAAICDRNLLRAVIYRAKAVVFRVQKDARRAEEFYARAEESADEAMRAVPGTATASVSAPPRSEDVIWVEGADKDAVRVAAEVVSDVHFSHGYYWYQKHKYRKAEELFDKAIGALERAGETWDSPYTRLAIVQFCQGRYREAGTMFARARFLCEKTVNANREASLSLALCSLGSRVIGLIARVRPAGSDPLADLRKAIDREPKLALGPLECHRQDAEHFLERRLPQEAREVVEAFMAALDREIQGRGQDETQVPPEKIRILFLAAGPDGTVRLRFDRELRDIQEQLRLSEHRERFELSQAMAARPKDLTLALLSHKAEIVHFSGHGRSDGKMIFEDDDGRPLPIDPSALAQLFAEFAPHIHCVILNACYSQKAALAIGDRIDLVIGMDREVADTAAIRFAVGFYQALGAGKPVEEAYRLGCIQVVTGRDSSTTEDAIPVLVKSGHVVRHK